MAIQAQLYSNNIGFPLCGSQDFMKDNASATGDFAHSCFNLQSKHHCHQQQQQHLPQLCNQRPNTFLDNNLLVPTSKPNIHHPPNSQTLALQFEMHGQEIDRYIRLQNEKLRVKLQEQRKQQVATLLKKTESDMLYLLRQKDEEIALATKKNVELETFLNRLEAENQAWRRMAQENEAVVLSLHNTLEQMKERTCCLNNGVTADDAQSCCDESTGNPEMGEEETGENRAVGCGGVDDNEQITRKMMVCKGCNSRRSCFLFLPCRHLCSCDACEAFLEACPVCRMPKKATIETLIF